MKRTVYTLLAGMLLVVAPARAAAIKFDVQLPTPRSHYKTYDADEAALELLNEVMQRLDPQTREMAMKFLQSGKGVKDLPPMEPKQALALMDKLGLREFKPQVLEIFLHKSQVLDLVPEKYRDRLLPVVHDALLAFLDGLSEERLAERLVTMSRIPPETPRGEKVLILASKIPTLQKLGQIIARMDAIPPDVRKYLQTLESGISTMTRDELVADITEDVGAEVLEKYHIRFDDKILAEASVGAVIRGTFTRPGGESQEMVAKLIKPYARTGLPEEMNIIDGLIALVTEHASFYHLEGIPVKELFGQIREKLEEEILVTQEQANFRRAHEYYQGMKGIHVPEVYSFSTPDVTFMEFFHGVKITDAFPGDIEKRRIVAKHLAVLMTFDTLFSKPATSIFHGDPHPGNVMLITDDPDDPYAIGLLDWGLLGTFDREHRLEMFHLTLALRWRNRKRFRNNIGALIEGGIPAAPAERQEVFALADQAFQQQDKGPIDILGDLVIELSTRGHVVDPNLSLFIKSQLTLNGMYENLDPDLDVGKYVEKLVRKQVVRELPKRLLLLPAVSYRGYRSLMSNGDVIKGVFK